MKDPNGISASSSDVVHPRATERQWKSSSGIVSDVVEVYPHATIASESPTRQMSMPRGAAGLAASSGAGRGGAGADEASMKRALG